MSKNRIITIIAFFIIIFFLFRHCVKVGISIIEAVSSSVLYPVLRVQNVLIVPIARWFEERAVMQDLKNNYAQLEKENKELYTENIALKALHLHAMETSELRNFNERYRLQKGCVAQILARHFSQTKQFFLVDAGSSQGIKKDMVALYGNTIIGKVEQVYPWYCRVCLITDADCKITATCFSAKALEKKGVLATEFAGTAAKWGSLARAGVSGIHEGCNDVTYTIMRYVSHLESVNVNDTVFSSGEGLVFPRGFALGTIVIARKGELFYDITVQPALDFKTLSYCTLISKEDIG